ncbi:ABC transporter ATP-binding protein [Lactobacillus acetotolerans]|uniref:ABC transporter ATP-binding protein n=1 Tax=Lactobacillus acetotolerans TaxID=1600 RepID=UPI0007B9D934|nr:ABC transporter ATP-binding protein [Lactobacillus acetotolerans]QGV04700.1 ATP-binding cassette domain-containing protein [Lactobacillus acetotolerans]
MDAIVAKNITKSYGKHQVLKGINLNIKQGEIFTLLGENGAGKSTLISILTTLSKPDSGNAFVLGKSIKSDADNIRENISVNSQFVTLDNEFTGYQNMKLVAQLLDIKDVDKRIKEVSQRLNLSSFINRKIQTYSGGMKRRLDIGVSILGNTNILFLDEPTTGVDPKNRLEIWKLIRELRDEGKTVFLTTQYLDEADKLSDMIAFIRNGKISLQGTPEQLKSQTNNLHKIVVPTKDLDLAAKVFNENKIEFKKVDDTFEIQDSILQTALKQLINANIVILEINPVKQSLEDVFLNATKGEQQNENN